MVIDSPTPPAIALIVAIGTFFVNLGNFPLDARFTIIGLSLLTIYLALVRLLWKQMARSRSTALLISALAAISIFCLASVWVFHQTAVYHNVTYFRNGDNLSANAEYLVFRPAHSLANVQITVSVHEGTRLEKLMPANCDPHQVVISIENESLVAATYALSNFIDPQCFTLSYQVLGPKAPTVEADVDPATVALITPEQYSSFHRTFYALGGLACSFGTALLLYRFWSLRP